MSFWSIKRAEIPCAAFAVNEYAYVYIYIVHKFNFSAANFFNNETDNNGTTAILK